MGKRSAKPTFARENLSIAVAKLGFEKPASAKLSPRDALAIRKTRMWMLSWFLHGCSGHSKVDVIMVPAWMRRNASFKNELLRGHCAGDLPAKGPGLSSLKCCPANCGPTWHPRAPLVWKGAARHERYNAQEAGHVQYLQICRSCLSQTRRPHRDIGDYNNSPQYLWVSPR